jgi:hypothetical protein
MLSIFVLSAVALALPANAGMAVKFIGTADATDASDLSPDIAQAIIDSEVDVAGFACFELPLVDLKTGRTVGIGVDCLNPFDDTGDANGAGIQIEAKTFFFFPKGLIVTHGCTSVRPFFSGVGDAGVTHMTGSIGPDELDGAFGGDQPEQCANAGGIIHASGGFKNHVGEVRLSGAVNLSAFPPTITFRCLFTLDVAPRGRS